jgi:hypothetical protein
VPNRRPTATFLKLYISKRHDSYGVSVRHLLPLLHLRTANQPTIAAAALFIKTQRWIPLLFIPGVLVCTHPKQYALYPSDDDSVWIAFLRPSHRTTKGRCSIILCVKCSYNVDLKNRRIKNQCVVKVGGGTFRGCALAQAVGLLVHIITARD